MTQADIDKLKSENVAMRAELAKMDAEALVKAEQRRAEYAERKQQEAGPALYVAAKAANELLKRYHRGEKLSMTLTVAVMDDLAAAVEKADADIHEKTVEDFKW